MTIGSIILTVFISLSGITFFTYIIYREENGVRPPFAKKYPFLIQLSGAIVAVCVIATILLCVIRGAGYAMYPVQPPKFEQITEPIYKKI